MDVCMRKDERKATGNGEGTGVMIDVDGYLESRYGCLTNKKGKVIFCVYIFLFFFFFFFINFILWNTFFSVFLLFEKNVNSKSKSNLREKLLCEEEMVRVCVCAFEKVCVCVCVYENESVCVCVRKRERMCVCVRKRNCVSACVCVRKGERESVCG
jgi:hypothetical protein